MSTTIAHRHHVHVPLAPILAVIVTALIAAAVIMVINQPTSTTTQTKAVSAPLARSAAVPLPETLAVRHQALEAVVPAGAAEVFAYPRNHVQGVTLDAGQVSTEPSVPPVSGRTTRDRYLHSHFPGKP